jgi:hypothetical protein
VTLADVREDHTAHDYFEQQNAQDKYPSSQTSEGTARQVRPAKTTGPLEPLGYGRLFEMLECKPSGFLLG